MKAIEMAGGHFALVDDEDFATVSLYRWSGKAGYARATIYVDGRKKCLYMHRLIMGAGPGQMVDHRDMNGLNNQRSNLRFCSKSENMHNCRGRKSRKDTIPYKGVNRSKLRYNAMIRVRGVRHYLGHFRTAEEARDAYNAAERRFFGEFSQAG